MENSSQYDGYLYNGEAVPRLFPRNTPDQAGLMRRALSYLGLSRKSAPLYGPGLGGQLSDLFRYGGWGWNRDISSQLDYASEVGPLDNSYLIMAVINWTATQLPEARPVVQKPGKNGALEPDWGHPAADLIRRPNKFDIWANDCGALSVSWWIDGNVYWYKSRDISGQVVELWYLPHFLVEERWPDDGKSPEVPKEKDTDPYLSHYQYRVPGKEPVLYPAKDILHIKRGKDLNNPRRGVGAFNSAIRDLYSDQMMAQFSATIMRNMGIVVPLLTPKNDDVTIDPTQARAIEEAWVSKTTGRNTGRPIINSIPLDVTKFSFSPHELDLSRLRLIPQSVIAALSGVPAALLQFMVGLENGTSYAAYREARQQGYESVIIPMQAAIGEQLTWQLLSEYDDVKGASFIFDTSTVRVLQEDRDALYRRATSALSAGGISRNQFQASLGKPVVDKDEVYYVPAMSTPMTQERIEETATGNAEVPPVDPNVAALGKLADLDRMFQRLEDEMRGFEIPK